MLTKWRCWFWDPVRAPHVIVHKARQNALIRSLWWLEVKDCNENWHEGGYGRSLSNGIVGFGITRAKYVILRKARQKNTYLQFIMAGSEGLHCNPF